MVQPGCIQLKEQFMSQARAYATTSKTSPFSPIAIERRALRPNDVDIEILYCGVCHTDLHTAKGEWDGIVYPQGTIYPCVPGHEIVGRVRAVGPAVTKFEKGQIVGVGTLVDSCQECEACKAGEEPYCEQFPTNTYNSNDRLTGENTLGGYADSIVVREEFVLRVRHDPAKLAAVAPLLCAGVTMWSPLKHWNVAPGMKVGIVGIGGLGHMGVKLAKALGAHVVAFTTSESKRDEARKLGADEVVVSRRAEEMAAQAGKLDLMVNTVAVSHNLDSYLGLLRRGGTMTLVGIPAEPHPAPGIANLIVRRRSLAGSLVGGIKETQEMLDFCADHNVTADVEEIAMQEIEVAFDRMVRSDVKYRFVIDMRSVS
jgi:alcohol dehydrogenase (NADP+)